MKTIKKRDSYVAIYVASWLNLVETFSSDTWNMYNNNNNMLIGQNAVYGTIMYNY